MQLPGDALPAPPLVGEPALKLVRDAADAQTDHPRQQGDRGEQHQRREPPRLVESRLNRNSQTRSNSFHTPSLLHAIT